MRVWFVNQYAIPPGQSGITRHFELAKGLKEQGHDVTIIASGFDHVTRKELHLKADDKYKIKQFEGVDFLFLKTPPYPGNTVARMWNMFVFCIKVLTQLKNVLGKPDLIVGSSPHLPGALSAQFLARRLSVPFILEVRDLWPQSLIDLGNYSSRHPYVRILKMMERYLYQQADKIVSLLPSTSEYMINQGASKDKLHWIPNGVRFENIPRELSQADSTPFSFVYAGAHGLANALETIVDAAYELKSQGFEKVIRIKLIGDGPEKARLEAKASSLGLNNLDFSPPVSKELIYQELQKADGFILTLKNSPLFKHGLSSNKLFDYLASQRPIVFAVDWPGNPVEKVNAGFAVAPENPKQLADAMLRISSMSLVDRQAMGHRGRNYVEENHDINELVKKYQDVLNECTTTSVKSYVWNTIFSWFVKF